MRVRKTLLFELSIVGLLAIVIVVFHQRPPEFKKRPILKNEPVQGSEEVSLSKVNPEKIYNHIKNRNIFDPLGSYKEQNLPENPYTLVGVLKGKESIAILREFTGRVLSVKEGDNLIDGAKVMKILEDSVIIKRLNTEETHKLFKITPKKDGRER